jgi:hypothetical protein
VGINDDVRGASSQGTRAPNRRRSLSLDTDSKIARLETEVAPLTVLATDADSLRLKVTNLERDLLGAQNDTLASEQPARREREEANHLLGVREDELAELRFLAQDSGVSDELRGQLAEKEEKLRAIWGGISSLEGWLMRRVEEIEADINEQKQRAAARVMLSPTNSSVQTPAPTPSAGHAGSIFLLEQVQTSEFMPADKERIFVCSGIEGSRPHWEAPSPTSRPHSGDSPEAPKSKSLWAEDPVPRAEYDTLYEQCLRLEEEVEGRDMVLRAERAAISTIRAESGLLKAELQVRLFGTKVHYRHK